MLIESSTVMNCSPVTWISRSVRPSVGRISAVSPHTACERLSFVETCAVSRQFRTACSVNSLSGVARTKLPAKPTNNFARPSRMARIESTRVQAVPRRGSEPELVPQRIEERLRHLLPDAHRAVALDIAMPAHRADTRPRPTQAPAQHQEVHDLADRRDAVLLLGNAHRPARD